MLHSSFRLILKNTLAQGFGKAGNIVFTLLATMVLRRSLQREGYGEYIFILSLITVLVALADFGTHLVGVKEASRFKKRKQILGNVILLRSLFSLATVVILLFLFFTPLKIGAVPLLITAFLLPILSFRTSLNLFFHAKLELEKFALIEVFHSLLFFLLVMLGRLLGKGLEFFLLSLLISNLSVLSFFAVYFNIFKRLEFKVDKSFLKRFFRESLPMGGILVLFTLYSRVDSLLLKILQGEEAVGIYGLSFKIYENLTMPAAFLMNAYLPLISKEAAKIKQIQHFNLLKNLLKSALLFLLLTALFLIFAAFVFSPLIVRILAGGQLVPEVLALRLLLPAVFFAFLNHLTGYTLLALGQQRKSFVIALIALFFNLFSNLIFIPRFSFKACSIITVLTEVLVFALSSKAMFNYLRSSRHSELVSESKN